MKLTYAPQLPLPLQLNNTIEAVQYNCNINSKICDEFSMPIDINAINDITFYMDLSQGLAITAPSQITAKIICNCQYNQYANWIDAPIGDLVGSVIDGIPYAIVKLNIDPAQIVCDCFNILFTVQLAPLNKRYFVTQKYCKVDCEEVEQLTACYPLGESVGNRDCNGVYYGFADKNNYIGNPNLTYKHMMFIAKEKLTVVGSTLTFVDSEIDGIKSKAINEEKCALSLYGGLPNFYEAQIKAIASTGFINYKGKQYRVSGYTAEQIVSPCCETFLTEIEITNRCENALQCSIDGCASCRPPEVVYSDAFPSGIHSLQIEVVNPTASIGAHAYTIDGGMTWINLATNPTTIPYPTNAQTWTVAVRLNCGDGTYAVSPYNTFGTPMQPLANGYCVKFVKTGLTTWRMDLYNSLNQLTNATVGITRTVNHYIPADGCAPTNKTFTIPLGSSGSNIITTTSPQDYFCDIPPLAVHAGTITDPNFCNLSPCNCNNCIHIVNLGGGQFEFIYQDCGCYKNTPTDIIIYWGTNLTANEPNVTILSGNSSVIATATNLASTSAIMYGNSATIGKC